jgi:hypothetical protein
MENQTDASKAQQPILTKFWKPVMTDSGPVLVYKWDEDLSDEKPYHIVVMAVGQDGDQLTSTTRFEHAEARDLYYADAEKEATKAVRTLISLNLKSKTVVNNA